MAPNWIEKVIPEPAATADTAGFGAVEFGAYKFSDGITTPLWVAKAAPEPA